MSQERQWTDPVSLGSVNRDYDQGFADGCSESKRLNENLVAAFAQGRAAGLEALDVEVILDTMKQYFSTKESPFGAGGTIVQGGIGSVIEFAHAIRSISPTSSDAGKDDARDAARLEVPHGWEDAIAEARNAIDCDEPTALDRSGYKEYANVVLDGVADKLAALSSLEVIGKGEKE